MDFFGNSIAQQHKVAIVSPKESFSVMGIKKKLLEAGIEGVPVKPNIFQLGTILEENEPIIYYLDEYIYTPSGVEFLNDLKDLCLEQERLVILVGAQSEYENAVQIIPKSAIVDWFARPVDMDALLAKVESALNGEIAPAKKYHVLIIDDDVTYMRMLHEQMKERYQITMFDSGTKAIHWLMDNKDIDLILLDYEMPSMDGPTVFQMLKSDPTTRDTPVMFLTGKNDRDLVIKAVDMCPVDYILKSIDKKMLVDKLEEYFRRSRKIDKKVDMWG